MAQIRETLTLEDRFSATFAKYVNLAEQGGASTKQLNAAAREATRDARVLSAAYRTQAAQAAANAVEQRKLGVQYRTDAAASRAAAAAARAQVAQTNAAIAAERLAAQQARNAAQANRELDKSQEDAAASANGLTGAVSRLAGVFLGMQSVKWLTNTSDQLTQTNARLKLMTGSAEAAAEANDQIYAAAMRSRGAYADMADTVAKLGTLAPNAFTDTGEIVAFAEQLQKQMALSGTSTQGSQAAMLQLTQGLASGVLRGEELNSILEQTPMIAQTIAEYMGVTTGEMRELASEGAVTAEVVKNAMLGAAEETNAAFEQMPMTWSQVWTQFQNIALRALNPILTGINWLANNIEIIGPIVLGVGAAFAVFSLAANWTNICTAATNALATAQKMLGAVMATSWGMPLIIIIAVVAAFYAVIAVINKVTGASLSAAGIIAGSVMVLAAIIGNTAIGLLNGIIQMVWTIFVTPFLGIIEWVINAAEGGFDSLKGAVANLLGQIISWFLDLGKVVTTIIDAIFGTDWTAGLTSLQNSVLQWGKTDNAITLDRAAPTIDYRFEYGKAWDAGYQWGDNLDLFGGLKDMFGTGYGAPDYDEWAQDTNSIAGDVSSINKSVNMADEDLKNLVDMAERQYVNQINLTAQTPVVTINGANTGNTEEDRRKLGDTIRDIILEQAAAGSYRSTARAYSGG